MTRVPSVSVPYRSRTGAPRALFVWLFQRLAVLVRIYAARRATARRAARPPNFDTLPDALRKDVGLPPNEGRKHHTDFL